MVVTPSNGMSFQFRSGTGYSTTTYQSAGKAAPYWVRVSRTSNTVKGFLSSDGINWTQLGYSKTIYMATNVYIGLCVSSHNTNTLNVSTLSNLNALP
jgi:hypothetical protein